VAGELDLATGPLLAAMLDDLRQTYPGSSASGGREGNVDVDLSMVTFADSYGLGPLLDSATTVLAASDRVWRVLHLLQPGVARIAQEGTSSSVRYVCGTQPSKA